MGGQAGGVKKAKLSAGAGVDTPGQMMKNEAHEEDWERDDATWQLLGKSAPIQPGDAFVEDAVRAVKLLPEADPWWAERISFSAWVGLAACGALAAFLLTMHPEDSKPEPTVITAGSSETWTEIQAAADAEMLVAAADHLDSFSDHELVTLIGF